MGGGGKSGGAATHSRETTEVTVERTYFDIVLQQFKANKLAVFGMVIVASLILIAIFAPFLANDKPLIFRGYRYRLYVETYDQLVYAHADLAGVGREGEEVVLPGLYDEGVILQGLRDKYQREVKAWDAGNPTWKQVQNISFGKANELLNRVRSRLEDSIEGLDKDNAWARGSRSIQWLRDQNLPQDVAKDLDALLASARKNLDRAYQAGIERRRKALLQQFSQMRDEVSKDDRDAIDDFAARYGQLITPDLYTAQLEKLRDLDALIVEVRQRLNPRRVSFEEHTHFPALRQLTWLDMLFMLGTLMLATVPLWGPFVPGISAQQQLTRKALLIVAVPIVAAIAWTLLVPAFNDTTDYQRGMEDGSISCSWRLMAPLRYGVNQNDPDAKHLAPWWSPFDESLEDRRAAAKAKERAEVVSTGDAALDARLATLDRRLEELSGLKAKHQGGYSNFLDFLNRHHMGTDGTGRDLMTRMIWGSRISLSIGFVAVGIYVFIGVIVGALAGYFGGIIDIVVSRVIEIVICFPVFFLILTVIAFIGPSIFNIMLVIGITRWTGVARLVRGEFLRLRAKDFVTAGKALGYSDARVIFRHILPNALAPVLVAATFGVASAILVESSLSFLGFGVKVPTPTWGSVLSTARESWIHWWITLFPGLAIFLTVTMYNLVGEGIRDAVDPKMRQ